MYWFWNYLVSWYSSVFPPVLGNAKQSHLIWFGRVHHLGDCKSWTYRVYGVKTDIQGKHILDMFWRCLKPPAIMLTSEIQPLTCQDLPRHQIHLKFNPSSTWNNQKKRQKADTTHLWKFWKNGVPMPAIKTPESPCHRDSSLTWDRDEFFPGRRESGTSRRKHTKKRSYPAWWTNILPWKMAIEIVDFPINSMVIFHGKMLVHQRVPKSGFWATEICKHLDVHGQELVRSSQKFGII